jgi:hypothetical protein
MGSSYYPISGYQASITVTGPTGPTGDQGITGPVGFGPTGNTGPSVSGMGISGDKLKTYFDNGLSFETSLAFKGQTGNTILIAGMSVGTGLSIYHGFSSDANTLNFIRIKGASSASGRAEFTVGLCGSTTIYLDYKNSASGFSLGITGISTIGTFIGYSGNTLISIPKTSYGDYSSFATKNVLEKTRGLGFSGATSNLGLPCNYITGGTFIYVDEAGFSAATGCKLLYIDPNCLSNNSVDLEMKNNVYVADMKENTTVVILGDPISYNSASSISLILMNAGNGPTAQKIGQKRFQLANTAANIMWPFGVEPCFCGKTGLNAYHFYNVGGNTWYGSVAFMTDSSLFGSCQKAVIQGLSVAYGACCINDGTAGGTCAFESMGECMKRGASAFWHAGLTCGSNPCAKTGGCCMSFGKDSLYSSLCLDGITCINCVSGRVYDNEGNTYNAYTFNYLGNGITCTSTNCPVGA